MISKKELVGNELLKEIISIRVDTLWKMLALKKKGHLPAEEEEGATGVFDNKGAIFVPGGIVLEDSDKNLIQREPFESMGSREFRRRVREAMNYDNATLIYHDGMASGVNLDNGFFAEVSGNILANRQAPMSYSAQLRSSPPEKINSQQITRSFVPTYINPPYGSRTKLSSCISVCLLEPRLYYIQCRSFFGLRGNEQETFWDHIRLSKKPVMGRNNKILAPPFVVVCHTTRYGEGVLCGITRILGFGKFGEFVNFTLEELSEPLQQEMEREGIMLDPDYIFAEYEGMTILGVLRTYARTNPGRRFKKYSTRLVSPSKDVGIELKKLTREAQKRYGHC